MAGKEFRIMILALSVILVSLVLVPGITLSAGEDPLKDMDLSLMLDQDVNEDGPDFLAITGYLESRNQLRIKDMGEPVSLRQRLWLESCLNRGSSLFRGFISGYLDYDPAVLSWTDKKNELHYIRLNEAYLTIDTQRADFIIGRKMMRWGTGDGINPMDLINPRDHRDPIASGRADTRVPILLVNGIFLLGPVTLEGVYIPRAEVNKYPLPDSPWEPVGLKNMRKSVAAGMLVLSPAEEPDKWFTDAEFALRAFTVWQGFDLALLYYNGYTDDPVYHRGYLTDGRKLFSPTYPRYRAYGFNFARGLERATIRGELAVKSGLKFSIDTNDPRYREDRDGLVSRNVYQGVIGFDRTFFTNFYINFQFFADFVESGLQKIATERKTHGISFEISNKFLADDLKAGLRGMYIINNNDSILEIFAQYKIGDNWQISPGLLLFNGRPNSRLGQYNKNDMVYLRLRYSF